MERRFTSNLFINANYTFSKALDNGLLNQNNAGFYQNSFYPGVEYGPSIFDRRHVFNLNWVYELPGGKGHLASFHNGFDRLVEGWYVSGIVTAWSGVPLVVSDSSGSQTWGDATVLGPASGAIQTAAVSTGLNAPISGTGYNFFSTGKSAISSFRPVQISTDGRSGRGNPITGLPYKNFELSLSKDTKITERLNSKFAADFFNVLNHPTFSFPNLAPTNSAFGLITSQSNRSRAVQLAARFVF